MYIIIEYLCVQVIHKCIYKSLCLEHAPFLFNISNFIYVLNINLNEKPFSVTMIYVYGLTYTQKHVVCNGITEMRRTCNLSLISRVTKDKSLNHLPPMRFGMFGFLVNTKFYI